MENAKTLLYNRRVWIDRSRTQSTPYCTIENDTCENRPQITLACDTSSTITCNNNNNILETNRRTCCRRRIRSTRRCCPGSIRSGLGTRSRLFCCRRTTATPAGRSTPGCCRPSRTPGALGPRPRFPPGWWRQVPRASAGRNRRPSPCPASDWCKTLGRPTRSRSGVTIYWRPPKLLSLSTHLLTDTH